MCVFTAGAVANVLMERADLRFMRVPLESESRTITEALLNYWHKPSNMYTAFTENKTAAAMR